MTAALQAQAGQEILRHPGQSCHHPDSVSAAVSPRGETGANKATMPHRVADFIRQSSTSLEAQLTTLKKVTRDQRRHESSLATSKKAASSELSLTSGGRHSTKKMTTGKHSEHRLSFPGLHLGKLAKEVQENPSASLECMIESPPIVFYGDAENSTGALVSGQLLLYVKTGGLPIESFKATLNIHVTQKRPFTAHCHDCTNQYTEVSKWDFLKAPIAMTEGEHRFPFSVLLGGHLPASMDGPLVSIAYEFKAEATPAAGSGPAIKFEKNFTVKRSLPPPDVPHHSVRVFPPTNIKANVHYPQVFHRSGQNTFTMRLDGIAKMNSPSTMEFWKLKKLTWRLEETIKTVAPACEKHTPKDKDSSDNEPPAKKGLPRTETRTIGEKTVFAGWKSNYNGVEDSCIEMEMDYAISRHMRAAYCDLKSRDGTEVSHQLMVEMVVSQEWAPPGKPTLCTQTGVGRILRMHFSTVLTECGGIGISWDNESPPIYQDVPPSPPSYPEEPPASPPSYPQDAPASPALSQADADDSAVLYDDLEVLEGPSSSFSSRRGSHAS